MRPWFRAALLGVSLALAGCVAAPAPAAPAVTEAAYKAAVTAAAACAEAGGFKVSAPTLEPNGWRWSFSIGGPTSETSEDERARFEDALAETYFRCSAQHLDAIEREYRMQRVVPAEQRSEVMAQFVRCVKDSGYSSIGESDSRATIDEKVARITDPAMRGKVEVCLGRFAGLWPETIA